MYSLKMNYRLLGKQSIASNALVTEEEIKEHGPSYSKELTSGYFIYTLDDMGEAGFTDGVGTQCLFFDEKICKYEDLVVGKCYLLLTDGNVVLFYKELTEQMELRDYVHINDTLVSTPYPNLYRGLEIMEQ